MTVPADTTAPRRRWLAGGAALVLAVAAGAYALSLRKESTTGAAAQPPPPAVPVQAAVATRADVPIELSGLGTVQGYNTVTIRVRVTGELQQVLFTEGQLVKRGELLAVIDPRPFQAVLDEAKAKTQKDKAALDDARLILWRYSDLAASDYTSRQRLDTQRSLVAQLGAQVAQDEAAAFDAATQLSYTRLVAPIDGRTGIRLIDQGNIVKPGDTSGIVVIAQMQPISVISTLPEQDLPAVQAALRAGAVEVTAGTRDGSVPLATGTLSLIGNIIDTATGTIRLKSEFANTNNSLWPGQFVELRVRTRVAHGVVTIPSAAVQRGPDGFFVYVVPADERVIVRAIKPGQDADGRTIVQSGLAEGERVVTAGQYRLAPNMRVTVRAPSAAGGG